jgi:predicted DCC family thiol-disulfide oxidoreductase YuxK
VTPILIFDGGCAFCMASARWLQGKLGTAVAVEPWQFTDLAAYGTDSDRATHEVLWVDEADRIHGGVQAFARWLIHSGGAWWVLGRVLTLPAVRWVAAGVYRLIEGQPADHCRQEVDSQDHRVRPVEPEEATRCAVSVIGPPDHIVITTPASQTDEPVLIRVDVRTGHGPGRAATRPGRRRSGVTRDAAPFACLNRQVTEQQGATDGSLVASPDGLELYRALGWSVAADMVIARSC